MTEDPDAPVDPTVTDVTPDAQDSQWTPEALLSNLPGMAYRWLNDDTGSMRFISDAAYELTGYRASAFLDEGGKTYRDVIHPDDRHRYRLTVQSALRTGEPLELTYRIRTTNGGEKRVWDQGRVVGLDDAGRELVEGMVMDITSQRALDQRTGASDRTFRLLYDQANDATFLLREGRFFDCNPQTEQTFGCSREEILQRHPHDFSPPRQPSGRDSAKEARSRAELAMAGVPQHFDWKHQRFNGEAFDAEVSLTRIDLEDGPALLGIVRDVTERVQVVAQLEQRVQARTEELATSEARYRSLFERSLDPLFIVTGNYFVDVNPAGLELLGASREQVVGAHVDRFVVEGERERSDEASYVANGMVKDFEIKVRRWSGEIRDCLLTGQDYLLSPDATGFEGTLRDITEWKRTEEALFEQTRESAVLDERNRIAREIHDTIAQGLTGIVLQLEAAEQAQEIDSVVANVHLARAKSLARESLQEARRSVWNLVPQVLQDGDLVEALDREVHRLHARGGIVASLHVEGEPHVLHSGADVAFLRICQEALMNVRKYAQARTVTVTLTYEAEQTRLAVEDNGAGFILSSVRSGSDGGGFGLTSMQQRAGQLSGSCEVLSQPGVGTRVIATIPVTTNDEGVRSVGGADR